MEVLMNKVRFVLDTAAFDARYQIVAVRTGGKYVLASEILLDPGACLSPEEAAQITRRFEQVLGRPLRTLEEIDRVKRRLEAENIEASKCAHEASTRHSSVVTPDTSNP